MTVLSLSALALNVFGYIATLRGVCLAPRPHSRVPQPRGQFKPRLT